MQSPNLQTCGIRIQRSRDHYKLILSQQTWQKEWAREREREEKDRRALNLTAVANYVDAFQFSVSKVKLSVQWNITSEMEKLLTMLSRETEFRPSSKCFLQTSTFLTYLLLFSTVFLLFYSEFFFPTTSQCWKNREHFGRI